MLCINKCYVHCTTLFFLTHAKIVLRKTLRIFVNHLRNEIHTLYYDSPRTDFEEGKTVL